MTALKKKSPVPLYVQLKQLIERQIAGGVLPAHSRVPSERELSEQYGISRMTVRQALVELIQDGRLYTRAGKGTFVAERKIMQNLQALTGFTQDLRLRGQEPSTRLLRRALLPASAVVAARLRIPEGTQVLAIERLRLADNQPMALEMAHLFFDGIERMLTLNLEGSLYALLSEEFGLIPTEAMQEFEARLAHPRERMLLNLGDVAPVLMLQRTTLDAARRPFEFVNAVYRGDRYRFAARLVRGEETE